MLVRHNSSKGDGGEMCTPTSEPVRTITTTGHQSVVGWPPPVQPARPAVEDCTFRMLEPREIQAAMAFQRDYRVHGTRREQVRQLGNAVTPPAAEWLISAVVGTPRLITGLGPALVRGPASAALTVVPVVVRKHRRRRAW